MISPRPGGAGQGCRGRSGAGWLADVRRAILGIMHRSPFTAALLVAIAHTAIGNPEHVVRLAGASSSALATLHLLASLHLSHHGQHRVEALVADDLGPIHRSQLVKGPVGQGE